MPPVAASKGMGILDEYITIDRTFQKGRKVPLACQRRETLRKVPQRYFLCFIEAGCLRFSLGETQYVCSGPAFLCLNPKQRFRLLSSQSLSASSIVFHPRFLNKNLTDEFIRQANFEDFCDLHDVFKLYPFLRDDFQSTFIAGLPPTILPRVRTLFQAVCEELEKQPDWYWTCRTRSYFMDILGILERMYYTAHPSEGISPYDCEIPEGYDDVSRILFAIWSQYYDPALTPRRLAALVNCDPSTVYRRFKKVTGTTSGEYLIQYRLYEATLKLRFTGLDVGEIARMSGFANESYFCRLFKSRYQVTPGEFRRQAVEARQRAAEGILPPLSVARL